MNNYFIHRKPIIMILKTILMFLYTSNVFMLNSVSFISIAPFHKDKIYFIN